MVSLSGGFSNREQQTSGHVRLPECAYKHDTNMCIQLSFFGFHTIMQRAVNYFRYSSPHHLLPLSPELTCAILPRYAS